MYYLLLWVIMQVLSGVATLSSSGAGIAYWDHIGGFLAGLLLMFILKSKQTLQSKGVV
jgi:membrane associated rhomboid family serine protease